MGGGKERNNAEKKEKRKKKNNGNRQIGAKTGEEKKRTAGNNYGEAGIRQNKTHVLIFFLFFFCFPFLPPRCFESGGKEETGVDY